MKTILILLTLTLLSSCDSGPVVDAKRVMTNSVKDPASIEFREVNDAGGGVVCGEYNAKNGFGAYNGFEPFAYFHGVVRTEVSEADLTLLCGNTPGKIEVYLYRTAKTFYQASRNYRACELANEVALTHNTDFPKQPALPILRCEYAAK